MNELNPILDALPAQFEFYHLGQVSQNPELQTQTQGQGQGQLDLTHSTAIAFKLSGDLNATVILAFSDGLDVSTYSELGNILVSKLATELDFKSGIGVWVSPPHLLDKSQLNRFVKYPGPSIRKTYAHFTPNSVIPLEAWVFPTLAEGVGYA